jgi:hypothetical protein
MEKRRDFTTIAVHRDVLKEIRLRKKTPRQSDNDVLKDIFLKPSGKKKKKWFIW